MVESSKKGLFVPVLVAGVLTLGVTLLRLHGEVQGWDPKFFSKEPGGHLAIVGIGWLVVPVGFWLGRRVAQSSGRPEIGKAILLHLLAVALFIGGFFAVKQLWPDDFTALFRFISYGSITVSLLSLLAWPRAWVVNLAYAVLARAGVIAVQYWALANDWGTHFEKVAPQLGEQPADVRAHMLMMAQATFWIPFTVIACGLFGVLGAATVRRRH